MSRNAAHNPEVVIGTGNAGTGCTITVNGGAITAYGGDYSAGIGAGNASTGCAVTVNGGSITAYGGQYGSGIGTGNDGVNGMIVINDGTVMATGGEFAAGIGCDKCGSCDVTINGGTVTATGGDYDAGIGGGYGTYDYEPYRCGGNVNIYGGTVVATGGTLAAGVGAGAESKQSNKPVTELGYHPVALWVSLGETDSLTASSYSAGYPQSEVILLYTDVHVGREGATEPEYVKVGGETYTGDLSTEELDALAGKKLVGVPAHKHSFTYTASGATITATCWNLDGRCTLDDGTEQHNHAVTLAIAASNATYDGGTHGATLNSDAWAAARLTVPTIQYSGRNDTSYSGADAPVGAGNHAASITLGEDTGAVTARAEYRIDKATINPTVSIEGWTYGDAAKSPTLGEGSNPGGGEVTYEYARKGSGDWSTTVPTAYGDYVVRATVAETANYLGGSATADFTIEPIKATLTFDLGGGKLDGKTAMRHHTHCAPLHF